MITPKKKLLTLLVSFCMLSTLGLAGCGGSGNPVDDVADAVTQAIEGNVTGEVGQEYSTKWFTFTVESLSTDTSYGDITAADGNLLAIASIVEKNTSGIEQAFGTFDWFVGENGGIDSIFYPLDPVSSEMMPLDFTLQDGEAVSYFVVIEFPADLANPHLMYVEADDQGNTYTTFKIPIV